MRSIYTHRHMPQGAANFLPQVKTRWIGKKLRKGNITDVYVWGLSFVFVVDGYKKVKKNYASVLKMFKNHFGGLK